MKVYSISAIQGQISFKKEVSAISYIDARNKFYNEEHRFNSYNTFSYVEPIFIKSITRRY